MRADSGENEMATLASAAPASTALAHQHKAMPKKAFAINQRAANARGEIRREELVDASGIEWAI